MWILCLAEDLHEKSNLILLNDKSKNIKVLSAAIFVWRFEVYHEIFSMVIPSTHAIDSRRAVVTYLQKYGH